MAGRLRLSQRLAALPAWVHWAGGAEQEDELAKRFETSVRCIPFEDQIPAAAKGEGKCILTGQPSKQRVVMAKAY